MTDLHWSEEKQTYCDVGINEDGPCILVVTRSICSFVPTDESYHECNEGYLSLFPLLLGLLPADSPHLGPILELMSDEERLWSSYGLRSLSKSHPLFGEGENYWKGPIWMPMNYMALRSLFKVGQPPMLRFHLLTQSVGVHGAARAVSTTRSRALLQAEEEHHRERAQSERKAHPADGGCR